MIASKKKSSLMSSFMIFALAEDGDGNSRVFSNVIIGNINDNPDYSSRGLYVMK